MRDVLQSVGISITLRESKVDAEYGLASVGTHHEVRWLDVPMNEVTRVNLRRVHERKAIQGEGTYSIDSIEQLVRKFQGCFEGESSSAACEEVFE